MRQKYILGYIHMNEGSSFPILVKLVTMMGFTSVLVTPHKRKIAG